MKDIKYLDVLGYITEQMGQKGGVFLNVPGKTANTMTIGWGFPGWSWGRPVFCTLVRPQRHTYGLIKASDCFTVSVPTSADLSKQLVMAGTLSGRDIDKFQGHGLTAAPALKVSAPIVAECGLHIECRIVFSQAMADGDMDAEMMRRCYPAHDFHDMFFGEVVACYATDETFLVK